MIPYHRICEGGSDSQITEAGNSICSSKQPTKVSSVESLNKLMKGAKCAEAALKSSFQNSIFNYEVAHQLLEKIDIAAQDIFVANDRQQPIRFQDGLHRSIPNIRKGTCPIPPTRTPCDSEQKARKSATSYHAHEIASALSTSPKTCTEIDILGLPTRKDVQSTTSSHQSLPSTRKPSKHSKACDLAERSSRASLLPYPQNRPPIDSCARISVRRSLTPPPVDSRTRVSPRRSLTPPPEKSRTRLSPRRPLTPPSGDRNALRRDCAARQLKVERLQPDGIFWSLER